MIPPVFARALAGGNLKTPAILALEDGTLFRGLSIGVDGMVVGEVVFNTSMTGYQEILTDPSYNGQLVTLTYPHIGNTGANPVDEESAGGVKASGLIVRDVPPRISSWRARQSLPEYLQANKVVAISEIDTRKLTRILRDKGALGGCIMAGKDIDEAKALEAARNFAGLEGQDLAKVVSTKQKYTWLKGSWKLSDGLEDAPDKDPASLPYHVVAYDFGVKHNTLRMMVDSGCRVTVVPAETPASEVLALNPDGVYLSNGPGDPEPCDYAIKAIAEIVEAGIPTFGICLGHQLLGLASGARTTKMKLGHHGGNHPVEEIATHRVMISSQNHGFAVDESSLPENLQATHRSLFDGSLQGIRRTDKPAFSFQGHPEASPGPRDVAPLFAHFVELMAQAK